jgi:hypothetical protein
MSAAIQAAAKAIAALDASPFNDRIDKSRAEIVKLEDAINVAFARQSEIQEIIRGVREQDLMKSNVANEVADALMDGDLQAATRPDTTLLDDELELLKQGVRELRNRIDVERQTISAQQQMLKREIGTAFGGLAEEFEATAKQASAMLIDLYAASTVLTAIGQRADMGVLERKLAKAMPGLAAHGEMIDQRVGGFDLPTWVEPILEAVKQFDATTGQSAPRVVQMPTQY